jgi:signal transduction histidine kinase
MTKEGTRMGTRVEHPADIGHFIGTIAEIARTLESPHGAADRITHVLGLIQGLVPCDRCALCTKPGHREGSLAVVPDLAGPDRAHLAEFLQGILQFMEGTDGRSRSFDSRTHLALPVIGQDEILGVLLVDREGGDEYESHHLRLLSAVCSQLGAYLTMVRLHHDSATQTTLLVDREQQLRGTARFREEFIGVIGHDLRNPLAAIRTGVHLLAKRAALDPPDVALVERVASSADRMSRMIDDLLDFTRGRLGGGIPLRRTFVDLRHLCTDVIEEMQTARGRPVRLDVDGDPRGHWDSDRLAQLLSNLVGNALQHSPADSLVRVRVRGEGAFAAIEVNNAGVIPREQLPQMFEPFRRGENASDGLGLGLYIVERIVSAHAGTITVRSDADQGTTFEVRLPRRRTSDRDGVDRHSSTTPVEPNI